MEKGEIKKDFNKVFKPESNEPEKKINSEKIQELPKYLNILLIQTYLEISKLKGQMIKHREAKGQ